MESNDIMGCHPNLNNYDTKASKFTPTIVCLSRRRKESFLRRLRNQLKKENMKNFAKGSCRVKKSTTLVTMSQETTI